MPDSITYLCPQCSQPLEHDGELLRCANDGYVNTPIEGIRDFLSDAELDAHESFLASYGRIRRDEERGSLKPEHYLRLPLVKGDDPHQKIWQRRTATLTWVMRHLAERAEKHGPLRVLDAGAGNCWMTRYLAERGWQCAALDINIDLRDGLAAGKHYIDLLPIHFDRVRADFARTPFADRSFDVVIFNGSFHYAIDRRRVVDEAFRLLDTGGEMIIVDTPFYHDPASGQKMLASRGGNTRSGFITYDELAQLADGRTVEMDHPDGSAFSRFKHRFLEWRLRREVASMPRVVIRA